MRSLSAAPEQPAMRGPTARELVWVALVLATGAAGAFALSSSSSPTERDDAPRDPTVSAVAQNQQNVASAPRQLSDGGLSRDTYVEQLRERVSTDLANFQSEPLDEEWAVSSSDLLRRNLADATADSEVEIVEVECRSTTCVATIRWPSYQTAFGSYRGLLVQPYSVNCRRSMSVPPPADPTISYEAHLFFRCERTRS